MNMVEVTGNGAAVATHWCIYESLRYFVVEDLVKWIA
jgi:hypothetical protein